MAKAKRPRVSKENSIDSEMNPPMPPPDNIFNEGGEETTGYYIVIFKEDAADASTISTTLSKVAGIKNAVSTASYGLEGISSKDLAESKCVVFEKLGMAKVGPEAMQSLSMSASDADSPILAIEPEYIAHLTQEHGTIDVPIDYLHGYKDAVDELYEKLTNGMSIVQTDGVETSAIFQDTAQFTRGLQATRVHTSRFTGQGIKVAVLDTGFDFNHPDFAGRPIIRRSFSGFPVQDINGHGTHCVGTSCGPQRPATGVRRYGIAFRSQIFVGKVFNNNPQPGAATGDIIAGIDWAVANGCRVVSLSLGANINQKIQQYEVPIQRALNRGTLVVAAAGNNANRPASFGFVTPPANADAALAVAAIDNRLRIAGFSARSSTITGVGGKVNIAGPGVAVFSSFPVSKGKHFFLNGTSMATPHVAGIAALLAQSTGLSGAALWNRLMQTARPLNISSLDVGAGLVQAPQ